ncbi:hypothetical protein, partial [Paraburkholderia sabiae]
AVQHKHFFDYRSRIRSDDMVMRWLPRPPTKKISALCRLPDYAASCMRVAVGMAFHDRCVGINI